MISNTFALFGNVRSVLRLEARRNLRVDEERPRAPKRKTCVSFFLFLINLLIFNPFPFISIGWSTGHPGMFLGRERSQIQDRKERKRKGHSKGLWLSGGTALLHHKSKVWLFEDGNCVDLRTNKSHVFAEQQSEGSVQTFSKANCPWILWLFGKSFETRNVVHSRPSPSKPERCGPQFEIQSHRPGTNQ